MTDLNQVSGGTRNRSLSREAFRLLQIETKVTMKSLDLFWNLSWTFMELLCNIHATFFSVGPQASVLARPLGPCSHQSCRIPAAVVLSSVSFKFNHLLIKWRAVQSLLRSGCLCFAGPWGRCDSPVSLVAAGSSLSGSSGVSFSSSSLDFPVWREQSNLSLTHFEQRQKRIKEKKK